jgi:hypothetical protein
LLFWLVAGFLQKSVKPEHFTLITVITPLHRVNRALHPPGCICFDKGFFCRHYKVD